MTTKLGYLAAGWLMLALFFTTVFSGDVITHALMILAVTACAHVMHHQRSVPGEGQQRDDIHRIRHSHDLPAR